MRRTLFLFCAFFMFSIGAYAQASTGSAIVHVVDENGDDFLGANVKVLKDDHFIKGNATDPFGIGNISFLEPGNYVLEVSAIGYQMHRQPITICSNQTVRLKVDLEIHSVLFCGPICTFRKPMIIDAYGGSTTFNTDDILKMPTER